MTTALSQTRRMTNVLGKLRHIFVEIDNIKNEIGNTGLHFLQYLSNQMKVKLVIEEDALQKTQGSLEQCLPLPSAGTVSLEEIFDLVISSNGLVYHLDNRALRVFVREELVKSNLQARLYDVSDLITSAAEEQFSYWGEEPALVQEDPYPVFGLNFAEMLENAPQLYYTESILAQLITEKVLKDRWQNFPLALVSPSPGKLFISHLPHVHDEIEHFLDTLRQLARIPLRLDTRFITCKTNFFKQVKLEFTPLLTNNEHGSSMLLYALLSPEQETELFTAIAGCKDAHVCFSKTLDMHPMETRYVSQANRTLFLAGYDEARKEDRLARMYEGAIVKARPQVHLEDASATLDLEIDVATLVKPLPTLPVADGEIALPSQLTQRSQVSIRFPHKQSLLLAGFANPYEDEGEKSFVASRKKEHLMFYWKMNV